MDEMGVFEAAIALTNVAERAAFLERECAGNPELKKRLEQLLEAHFREHSFLDQPTHVHVGSDSAHATPAPSTASLQVRAGNTIAGRYTLVEPIAEGGMGEVWVAQQNAPVKRRVAIKLIKPGMDSRAVIARFDAERQALAVMDHPNIAKVLDGGTTELGRPFFVMELVRGIPITDYCDQAQLTVRERLELFCQVCAAAQHAHQKGILHRDLKPSNILVTELDGRPVPKVIDFGLAKALHGVSSLTELSLQTSFGAIVGTPLYMAPEQLWTGPQDVDTRCDCYSLGVVLYELLTGTTPIERQRLKNAAWEEIRRLVREEEAPAPSTRLSSSDSLPSLAARRHVDPTRLTGLVRGELDWILLKALEKNRNRRYESASSLALDIQRHLAGEAVIAAPPSRIYRLRKFLRRNAVAVSTLAAIGASLLLGLIGFAWQAQVATEQREVAVLAQQAEARERQEAERQRRVADELRDRAVKAEADARSQKQLAERHEADALKAVRRFGDTIANDPELKNNPALKTLRAKLLSEPVEFFQSLRNRFLASPDSSPQSLERLGNASYDLGILTYWIGNLDDSLRSHREALEVRQRLADANPTIIEFQRDLADSHNFMGVVLKGLGKLEETQQAYESAITIRKSLVELRPESSELLTDLAASYNNLANVLSDLGRRTEALKAHEASVALQHQLADKAPASVGALLALARYQHNTGLLQEELGNQSAARTLLDLSLSNRLRLAETNPHDKEVLFDLASSHVAVGANLAARKQHADALRELDAAVAILAELLKSESSMSLYQREFAAAKNNVGEILLDMGKVAEAREAFEASTAMSKQLTDANPSVVQFQSESATFRNNLAATLQRLGKMDEALEQFDAARTIHERLARDNPRSADFRRELASTQFNIGLLLRQSGRLDDALRAYEASLKNWRSLVADLPLSAPSKSKLGLTLNNMALIDLLEERYDSARDRLIDGLAHARAALSSEPQNAAYRLSVRLLLENLIRAGRGLGDEELRARTERELEELRASDPAMTKHWGGSQQRELTTVADSGGKWKSSSPM